MAAFVGLDLAWTNHRESGICWLVSEEAAGVACTRLEAAVCDTDVLAEEIAAVPGTVVVAVDAPLLCTPKRWAEREINRRFGRYKASAHSAHAAVRRGHDAGVRLGAALRERGFLLDSQTLHSREGSQRVVVEVYPHTIHIRLFELEERIPYKQKSRRLVAERRRAMQEYQRHLKALIARETPGVLDSVEVRQALDGRTAAEAGGAALKRLEDKLDGLTCALAAVLAWRKPRTWEPIGDLNGYILVPREPA